MSIVTVTKSDWDRLNKLAYYDNLTGERNRNYLDEISFWKSFNHLYFFDINKLGEINKKLGHIAGDIHIKECVKLINRNMRVCWPTSVMIRYGGDEFIVLAEQILIDNNEIKKYTKYSRISLDKTCTLQENIERASLALIVGV